MKTSWHGDAFLITGPLWGESTSHRFPSQRAAMNALCNTRDSHWNCYIATRVVKNVSIRDCRYIAVEYNTHCHYNDIIMGAMASQITSLMIVCSTVCSGADQRKHQSSVSLAFVREIHRWPVNSPHNGPVTRKMFPFDNVIMHSTRKWERYSLGQAYNCQITIYISPYRTNYGAFCQVFGEKRSEKLRAHCTTTLGRQTFSATIWQILSKTPINPNSVCWTIYLPASRKAARSLRVVCLMSSKFFFFGSQVWKIYIAYMMYENLLKIYIYIHIYIYPQQIYYIICMTVRKSGVIWAYFMYLLFPIPLYIYIYISMIRHTLNLTKFTNRSHVANMYVISWRVIF